MTVPSEIVEAARLLGVDAEDLRALPGATGRTWATGTGIVRLVHPRVVEVELAAMAAAATVVPVPEVLARADLAETSALLLARLPGVPAADRSGLDVAGARRRGLACGRVYEALAAVPAPPQVPAADGPVPGDRLLHLDLHPLNVLVDEHGEVTGVLDWSNTAAGDPALDRARSWAILVADPAAVALRTDPRAAALMDGWAEAGGFAALPAAARDWGRRYLLADLARRYPPAELATIDARFAPLG